MSNAVLEALPETTRWRARDVKYWGGSVDRVFSIMPEFRLDNFIAGNDSMPNPYLKSVVRQPMTPLEKTVAVGVVSNSYGLAQHKQVAERCLDGLRLSGIEPADLTCELGLTELGEWMNLRLYLPNSLSFEPRVGDVTRLRLECFNSVDGSSRLTVVLSWHRLVCANGLIIEATKTKVNDVHNNDLDLDGIPFGIQETIGNVETHRRRLIHWSTEGVEETNLVKWVDEAVLKAWGPKAACRVLYICRTGHDVEVDAFSKGKPSEKKVQHLSAVPGAPERAETLYDVSQALTWIATERNNVEERFEWQAAVPSLLEKLRDTGRE